RDGPERPGCDVRSRSIQTTAAKPLAEVDRVIELSAEARPLQVLLHRAEVAVENPPFLLGLDRLVVPVVRVRDLSQLVDWSPDSELVLAGVDRHAETIWATSCVALVFRPNGTRADWGRTGRRAWLAVARGDPPCSGRSPDRGRHRLAAGRPGDRGRGVGGYVHGARSNTFAGRARRLRTDSFLYELPVLCARQRRDRRRQDDLGGADAG